MFSNIHFLLDSPPKKEIKKKKTMRQPTFKYWGQILPGTSVNPDHRSENCSYGSMILSIILTKQFLIARFTVLALKLKAIHTAQALIYRQIELYF